MTACAGRARYAMAERIDLPPELAGEREALWRQHREGLKGNSTCYEFTAEDRKEIDRLRAMSPLECDREIGGAADRLGVTVGTLRMVLRDLRRNNGAGGEKQAAGKPGAGQMLKFPEIEPWPDPVDGTLLLDEIATTVQRFIVTRDGVPEAVALWVLHTHAIAAAFITPRLAITSPERRCGKTTLLILLGTLVARVLSTANIKAAALFRAIAMWRPTLLIDEADTFLVGDEELRGIVNAGHCRANSTVVRTVELAEGYDVRGFDVFAALAIAAIGKLQATIEDRSIKVALYRRRPDEHVERLRLDRLDEFAPLSRRCARWAIDHVRQLSEADPAMPSELHDRATDNWRALLAIADLVGGDWPQRARDAAKRLLADGFDDIESRREMLLADLKAVFDCEPSGRSEEAIAVYEDLLARFGTATEPALREQVAGALRNKGIALGALGRSEEEVAVYDVMLAPLRHRHRACTARRGRRGAHQQGGRARRARP